MKLFFQIIFKIFLILTILAGCATTDEIKETDSIVLLHGEVSIKEGQYGLSYDQNTALQIWTKGVEYAGQGKFNEAKAEFEKALKVDPYYGSAKRSLKVIEDALDQKIKSKTAIHLFKGIDYDIKGQSDDAIVEHNKAIEINPMYGYIYVCRGNAYGHKGQHDKAISDYNKAIEINPRLARAYNNRGNAYADKGQYDRAISDYTKAIEINPRDAGTYFDRGNVYNLKGQYNKAISDFNKAIKINPRYSGAYNNRGYAYKFKGQHDKAFADLNKAIEINPRYPEAYNNRGTAYNEKGQYDKAISDYTMAIELYPRYAGAYTNRGNAYGHKGQHDKAISDYNKAIEIDPRYAYAYNNRGSAFGKKGKYDKAISDYTKAIEINPRDAGAYFNRGNVYGKKGQYDKAISDYTKAIEINPRLARAYNNRGFTYFFKKDYEKAWDDVHKAESLGFKVHPGFLKALRQASVRQTDIESTRVPVKQNRPREPSDPVIQSGVISILPGEKLFIEADLVDNKIVNLKHVKTNLNPARTFVLEFDQSGINVLKGSPGMFLSLKNPFGVPIKFNMEIVDFRGGLHQTSSCPVFPGIISKEMWPHSIPQLNISNPRVLAESGPFICY